MPETVRDRRPRRARGRAAAAAAVLTVLSLNLTACNDDPQPNAAPSAGASKPGIDLKDIQAQLANMKNWNSDDWEKFASQLGFKPEDFQAIKGYWDLGKLQTAQGVKPKEANAQQARTPSRAEVTFPTAIPARPEKHPYSPGTAVVGKIFMEISEKSYAECSGTVIADPQHPGKSNLVWTAAHCVHEGKGGTFFKKISFVPSYNKSGAASGNKKATFEQVAPFGVWAADAVRVTPYWTAEGGETGGPASQYDFAIMHVHNEDGGGKSLEETIGGSVPVWFNAQADAVPSLSAYGYPADTPFDGQELEHCDSGVKATVYGYDLSRPPMQSIGCTMTGGSSGGGWFAVQNKKVMLIGNTSVGNTQNTMLASPTLTDDARKMYEAFAQKLAK
ncbi:hypothetical protein GCM10010441_48820 [Kitasatospora paracochleata]|uniref:V8-like Glu-specific endopeptidase n=1 Tax=Kitasatospora paracochleata TaxID=58354 RepID=A0ABT1IRS8_9ACTN|nr:trypsin-like peptidase domain-containing protein [Kitasatospora paracochleata]MCP2307838.1 V8-like Glu-specific endopeptidase [Kitasatospora paracochleata]